jgi:hypothetical protein
LRERVSHRDSFPRALSEFNAQGEHERRSTAHHNRVPVDEPIDENLREYFEDADCVVNPGWSSAGVCSPPVFRLPRIIDANKRSDRRQFARIARDSSGFLTCSERREIR